MTYTILGDGPTDQVLYVFIEELLRRHGYEAAFVPVDLRKAPSTNTFAERIEMALRLTGCQLIFIHRDAENQSVGQRIEEIKAAWHAYRTQTGTAASLSYVPIIPIRMTEAWLLIDPKAIRAAAGFPNSKEPIDLPKPGKLELLPNPKQTLRNAVIKLLPKGRRRRNYRPSRVAYDVAQAITDFSALRQLSAYQKFEADLLTTLDLQATPPSS